MISICLHKKNTSISPQLFTEYRVTLGNDLPPIEICRPVGLPELGRLRRTFVKLMGQSSLSGPPLPTDANSGKRRFVDYLNREFGGSNA